MRLNFDGTIDSTFSVGTGFNGTVSALKLDPVTSKLYVGGYFRIYNGMPSPGIVRLNTNGSIDSTFNPGTGFEVDGGLDTMVFDATDSSLYLGGYFTSYNEAIRRGVVHLLSDGSVAP